MNWRDGIGRLRWMTRKKLVRWRRQRTRERRSLYYAEPSADYVMYRDRKGRPIYLWRWEKLWSNRLYRQVAWTDVGSDAVSTIWTGFTYAGGLFESAILRNCQSAGPAGGIEVTQRYRTEAAALLGHVALVRSLQG